MGNGRGTTSDRMGAPEFSQRLARVRIAGAVNTLRKTYAAVNSLAYPAHARYSPAVCARLGGWGPRSTAARHHGTTSASIGA
eukprot:1189402-Prymnesium_polylepis.2